MNRIPNGHDPKGTQSRIHPTPNGDHPKWHHPEWHDPEWAHDPELTPSQMDKIPYGHNPEWTQSRVDTIPNGHNPEWTQSRMDTIPNRLNLDAHHPERIRS